MKKYLAIFGVLLAVAAIVAFNSLFTVHQTTQALILQLGNPVRVIKNPGLHFKTPFIQEVNRFEKRWLEWDGEESEMPTKEKTYIYVDTYARWRIIDPLKFFTSVRDEASAQSRLDDIIDSETRNVIASHNLIEVV